MWKYTSETWKNLDNTGMLDGAIVESKDILAWVQRYKTLLFSNLEKIWITIKPNFEKLIDRFLANATEKDWDIVYKIFIILNRANSTRKKKDTSPLTAMFLRSNQLQWLVDYERRFLKEVAQSEVFKSVTWMQHGKWMISEANFVKLKELCSTEWKLDKELLRSWIRISRALSWLLTSPSQKDWLLTAINAWDLQGTSFEALRNQIMALPETASWIRQRIALANMIATNIGIDLTIFESLSYTDPSTQISYQGLDAFVIQAHKEWKNQTPDQNSAQYRWMLKKSNNHLVFPKVLMRLGICGRKATMLATNEMRTRNTLLQEQIAQTAQDVSIQEWVLANSYHEFVKKYGNANTTKEHLNKLYHTIQDKISPDLVILWWSTTREFMMWATEIRKPSSDIDLYTPNINFLENIAKYAKDTKSTLVYSPKQSHYFFMDLEWTPVSIAVHDIYGIVPWEHDTKYVNMIQVVAPELLASMKLKRKDKNWNYRPKDIHDIVNLLSAAVDGKTFFDLKRQQELANIIGSVELSSLLELIEQTPWEIPGYDIHKQKALEFIANFCFGKRISMQ